MSGQHVTRPMEINEQSDLTLKAQPTTLRRCLSCDDWMRSTGADHRLCNTCKGQWNYNNSLVGQCWTPRTRGKGKGR